MIARTDMAWPSFGDAKMPVHKDMERENEELRRRVAELEAKTLYQGQWKKLMAAMPDLEKFIEEHRHELSTKD
jgi:hypothetical protein